MDRNQLNPVPALLDMRTHPLARLTLPLIRSRENQAYLGIVHEIRTGGQSGVDQAVMKHAILHGVTLKGWVPGAFTAQVLIGTTFDDRARGIPETLRYSGEFWETSVQNLRDFLSTAPDNMRSDIERLILKAERNPATPAIRTELQVLTTDATLIISTASQRLRDGTTIMRSLADRYGKPCFTITLPIGGDIPEDQVLAAKRWITEHKPAILNVGGPRACHSAEFGASIELVTLKLLDRLFEQ